MQFSALFFFQNNRLTLLRWGLMSNPEIVSLNALIVCSIMKWPGDAAISSLHRLHHWFILSTLGQYIVNVQWSRTCDEYLSIFIFGIRLSFLHVIVKCYKPLSSEQGISTFFAWYLISLSMQRTLVLSWLHTRRIITCWQLVVLIKRYVSLSSPQMFSMNSGNSIRKNIFVNTVEGFDPATSCVRYQDATTVLARHMWETGSLSWL